LPRIQCVVTRLSDGNFPSSGGEGGISTLRRNRSHPNVLLRPRKKMVGGPAKLIASPPTKPLFQKNKLQTKRNSLEGWANKRRPPRAIGNHLRRLGAQPRACRAVGKNPAFPLIAGPFGPKNPKKPLTHATAVSVLPGGVHVSRCRDALLRQTTRSRPVGIFQKTPVPPHERSACELPGVSA